MPAPREAPSGRSRRARMRALIARVPAIRVALALSLLLHVVLLLPFMPQVRRPASELAERSDGRTALSVQLAPKASPAQPRAAVKEARRPPAATRMPKSAPVARPKAPAHAPPPVVTREKRVPPVASRPATAPAAATPAPRQPAEGDLAAYVEARRRARMESAAPPAAAPSAPAIAEDDNARASRLAAANLGTDRKPTFGGDTSRGGGIFSVQRLGYDYAEFLFFGWNKDIRRNTSQLIEVRKGAHSDIRLAVVRRMIVIIREHETGDFTFESRRLNRHVTLSARLRDTAGLEDFLMREFFATARPGE